MYAETFQVGAWLEGPAKWLRWAMQASAAKNFKDAQYNLQQFWKSLETFKSSKNTPKQWAEVLTLDGQSQWALGNYLDSLILASLAEKNDSNMQSYAGFMVPFVGAWIAADGYLTKEKLSTAIPDLTRQKNLAFANAKKLNDQASDAYKQSNAVNNQVNNAKTVFSNSINKAKDVDSWNKGSSDRIDANNAGKLAKDVILDYIQVPVFGLPVWVWAVAALGVVLLIPKGPTIQVGGASEKRY